jgi:hypothetical protein
MLVWPELIQECVSFSRAEEIPSAAFFVGESEAASTEAASQSIQAPSQVEAATIDIRNVAEGLYKPKSQRAGISILHECVGKHYRMECLSAAQTPHHPKLDRTKNKNRP